MANEPLHYVMCGLDNVYLLNGFHYKETPRGRRLHIADQEELHTAIGQYLIRQSRGLSGKELRFLREETGLSQVNLARLLGESDQSVARREKRNEPFKRPPAQERLLRYLYGQKVGGSNEPLLDFLQALADADNAPAGSVSFESDDHDWKQTDQDAVA